MPLRLAERCADRQQKIAVKSHFRIRHRLSTPFITKKASHTRGFLYGPEGIRTLGLCVANAALSQLSYEPKICRKHTILRSGLYDETGKKEGGTGLVLLDTSTNKMVCQHPIKFAARPQSP